MSENERIRILRKTLNLTMEKFGEALGVTRTAISNIENGNRNVTEQMRRSICREFGVNEIWLRTGEGGEENMFTEISVDDRFALSLGKLSKSDNRFLQNALIILAEMEPEKIKLIEEFMKKCLGIKE